MPTMRLKYKTKQYYYLTFSNWKASASDASDISSAVLAG